MLFLVSCGPCQPLASEFQEKIFPSRKQGDKLRSFHDGHYFKKLPDNSLVKRTWISYSPSSDKVFCIICKLFGTMTGRKSALASNGINDWKHISSRLASHEPSPDHLQSVIRNSMYVMNQRVDIKSIRQSSNSKIAENREILKTLFEIVIFLARQNLPFRGHDESLTSRNRGNFLELVKLVSKNHPLLSSHLAVIENARKHNRLTFLSNITQNKMISILGELLRKRILENFRKF